MITSTTREQSQVTSRPFSFTDDRLEAEMVGMELVKINFGQGARRGGGGPSSISEASWDANALGAGQVRRSGRRNIPMGNILPGIIGNVGCHQDEVIQTFCQQLPTILP